MGALRDCGLWRTLSSASWHTDRINPLHYLNQIVQPAPALFPAPVPPQRLWRSQVPGLQPRAPNPRPANREAPSASESGFLESAGLPPLQGLGLRTPRVRLCKASGAHGVCLLSQPAPPGWKLLWVRVTASVSPLHQGALGKLLKHDMAHSNASGPELNAPSGGRIGTTPRGPFTSGFLVWGKCWHFGIASL